MRFLITLSILVCVVLSVWSDGVEEVVDDRPRDVAFEPLSEEQMASLKTQTEAHEFQAEVHRLMDIIINSLYTKKEVFMRELISNAADALEKLRFMAIEDPEILGKTKEMQISVEFDKDEKTITVQDTGIGMTKEDLINNLGTVAKSGTSNFLEAMASGGDVNLIGQFGVGFYAAFLVADKVTVVSKCNDDDDQYIWESTADASFSVVKDPRGPTLGRGTRITLHLKDDALEYQDQGDLQKLIKKYSQFVNFPIYFRVEKTIKETVDLDDEVDEEKEKETDEDEVKVEEGEEKEEKPKTKEIEKTVMEFKKINIQKPLWLRPKEDITEAEYLALFRSFVKDDEAKPPLATVHFSAEGEIEFKAVIFVPPKLPRDPYAEYFNKEHDIRLYVRRVLIGEQFDDLIPRWLSFVKGVIDSDDLPLKVDRESVSQSKVIKVISKRVTRKILDVLRRMGSDSDDADEELQTLNEEIKELEDAADTVDTAKLEEKKKAKEEAEARYQKYMLFWDHFGKNVKLGCADDEGSNKQKIGKLLRYTTSKNLKKQSSLNAILNRTPEDQSSIYYITGESAEKMMKSPLMQVFIQKDVEVVLLHDAVDESCITSLQEYEGKKLVSIEKGELKFDVTEEEKAYNDKLKELYRPLTVWWKKQLTGHVLVNKVQLSTRLVNDPVGVVVSQYGTTAFQEKIVRYQTFMDPEQLLHGRISRILEINPQHPLIRKLKDLHASDPESAELKALSLALAETGLLASGFAVDDPTGVAGRLYNSMAKDLGVDLSKEYEKIVVDDIVIDNEVQREWSNEMADQEFEEMSTILGSKDFVEKKAPNEEL